MTSTKAGADGQGTGGKPVRVGWADASKRIAAVGDDLLVWPEFANEGDEALRR